MLSTLVAALETRGIRLEAWALAWARLAPLVTLLPAFGARLLPPVGRAVLGLALALLLAPALEPVADVARSAWGFQLLVEAARGLPVALGAAALLWAASMAGGLVDELRGSGQVVRLPMLEGESSALGALFGLFAALGFLTLGGVQRAVEALSVTQPPLGSWLLGAVGDLVSAIDIALALAAPLLAVVILFEVAGALMARAANPAHIRALLTPARALVVLAVLGFSLDAVFEWLLGALATAPSVP